MSKLDRLNNTMNVLLLKFIDEIPAGRLGSGCVIDPNEKRVLMCVAMSNPQNDNEKRPLDLKRKLSKTEKPKGGGECPWSGIGYLGAFYLQETNIALAVADCLSEKLPISIRTLCKSTGLSVGTVRSAKKSLTDKGFLVVDDGKWLIDAGKLAKVAKGAKKRIIKQPNRARPKTVAINKERAAAEVKKAEEAKRKKEKQRKDLAYWARLTKTSIKELERRIEKGESWFDEDDDFHFE